MLLRRRKTRAFHAFILSSLSDGTRTLSFGAANPPIKRGCVRITRTGNALRIEVSEDAKTWKGMDEENMPGLPAKLKVGVFAESAAEGTFEAVFDQFSLTPLK